MAGKSHVALIWRVFWILLIVTALELAVAFSLPHEWQVLRVSIFLGMTLIKAYYIVSEFMHLRYEVKSLIWSILLPTIFIIWLVVALIIEGGTT
jgi:cytochrome c oxidase subunit IV